MEKLLNEEGKEVEVLKKVSDVKYEEIVLETVPFSLKIKSDALEQIKEKVDDLIDKGKIEKSDNIKENFIISKMKKKPGTSMKEGDFDKSYKLFKGELDL
jgi:hypothetical protein